MRIFHLFRAPFFISLLLLTWPALGQGNSPPSIQSIPPVFVPIGSEYFYELDVIDPEDDALIFSLQQAPPGMWVNSNGIVRWLPTDTTNATYQVEIEITDTFGNLATQSFPVTVASDYFAHLDLDTPGFYTGQIVDSELPWTGMRISANNFGDGADKSVIFDTNNPSGGSSTLGAPFSAGPGNNTGEGDQSPSNVLVISDRDDCEALNDFCFNPGAESASPAGWIEFEFAQPATIHQYDIFGIKDGSPALRQAVYLDNSSQPLYSHPLQVTGQSGWGRMFPEIAGVYKMRIHFDGVAAIDNLQFDLTAMPIPDVDGPVISVTAPVDGAYFMTTPTATNGSLSEDGSLLLNGNALSLDSNLEFIASINLVEGENSLTYLATDASGNTSTQTSTVYLDTVAPQIVVSSGISVEPVGLGTVRVTGLPGTVEGDILIRVTNSVTGASVLVQTATDGSFVATLSASDGDLLTIVSVDLAGNESEPLQVNTPGTPSDPALTAPELPENTVTPFFDRISFLYDSEAPVQFGVDQSAFETRRIGVARGRVIARDGAPLAGARISIKDHPEFGYTWSRPDGHFDLAVNGGGVLTVDFELGGHLPSQRSLDIRWNEMRTLPDVALIPFDSEVTTINLATLDEMAVSQGSVITDNDGTRRATVMVPPGTTASMTLPDGTPIALSQISIRATEYTVGSNGPASMPGPLPPTSEYTYAVELSVDEAVLAGATRVDFSQPLPFHVDNFLEFPAGTVVPLGWYDRASSRWVRSESGIVIDIVGISNGIAQLDSDGDGLPDPQSQLDTLHITSDELQSIASIHQPGDSIWRLAVTHFTPFDANWPARLPADAQDPPPEDDTPDEPDEDDCEEGCIIDVYQQTLRETIPVIGTGMSLAYSSWRVPARKSNYTISVPIVRGTLPESLHRVYVEIDIAGRHISEEIDPGLFEDYVFVWDGLDVYGRKVVGSSGAYIKVGFEYFIVYGNTGVFGEPGDGTSVTVDRARQTITTWREHRRDLVRYQPQYLGLSGWSLSPVHSYDGAGKTLLQGDGSFRNIGSLTNVVHTFAGTGVPSSYNSTNGDGSQATSAQINPMGLATYGNGSVLIADWAANRIRHVDVDGNISTVAGTGTSCSSSGVGFCGEEGPATLARLHRPQDVALAADGNFYISQDRPQVMRVDESGIIHHFAGGSAACTDSINLPQSCGDGGPAVNAKLGSSYCCNPPNQVEVAPDGTVYILSGHRVRRIDSTGVISTVFVMQNMKTMHVVDQDEIYVSVRNGSSTSKVYKWTPAQGLQVFAGSSPGYLGDGGLATSAKFGNPEGLFLDSTGNLYVGDTQYRVTREIDGGGIIRTVAGTGGSQGSILEGAPALASPFASRFNYAEMPDGSLLISDKDQMRVIKWQRSALPIAHSEATVVGPVRNSVCEPVSFMPRS